jgi:hypothetical protein
MLSLPLLGVAADPPASEPTRYIPAELQATDPTVRTLLDAADQSSKLGNLADCSAALQKALEFTTRQKSLGDRAIVEVRLGGYFFTQGKLEDAKSQWLKSLADGMSVANLDLLRVVRDSDEPHWIDRSLQDKRLA